MTLFSNFYPKEGIHINILEPKLTYSFQLIQLKLQFFYHRDLDIDRVIGVGKFVNKY